MKIDGFGSIISTNSTTKKRGVSASGNFAGLLASEEASESEHPQATNAAGSVALVNNFLALQEIPDELLQRKKLVQQGNSMLDTLENLRRQLLSGHISYSTLRDIEREVNQQKQMINDPQLQAIVAEIELRAAVEMAKLQYADATTPVFQDDTKQAP